MNERTPNCEKCPYVKTNRESTAEAKRQAKQFADFALQDDATLASMMDFQEAEGTNEDKIKRLHIKNMRQQASVVLDGCDEFEKSVNHEVALMSDGCEGPLTLRHRNLEALAQITVTICRSPNLEVSDEDIEYATVRREALEQPKD